MSDIYNCPTAKTRVLLGFSQHCLLKKDFKLFSLNSSHINQLEVRVLLQPMPENHHDSWRPFNITIINLIVIIIIIIFIITYYPPCQCQRSCILQKVSQESKLLHHSPPPSQTPEHLTLSKPLKLIIREDRHSQWITRCMIVLIMSFNSTIPDSRALDTLQAFEFVGYSYK